MTLRFPIEIVLKILDHFSLDDAMYFHYRLPRDDPLQPLLVQRIHSRVIVNFPVDYPGFYQVQNETDLRKMVELNAPIQHLEIWARYHALFMEIVSDYPEYFSNIPSLVYRGSTKDFLEFISYCLMDNLVELDCDEPIPELTLKFAPKLTKLICHGYRLTRRWPPSLKYLELWLSDLSQVVFPDTLEELMCSKNKWGNGNVKFPPGLKKLKFLNENINLEDFYFPEGLTELILIWFDPITLPGERLLWPSTLKRLELSCISIESEESVEFPSGLESLDIMLGDRILPYYLVNFRYPPHLKELSIHGCKVDASHVAKLPATLESLCIICDRLGDTKLPLGLKLLSIFTFDPIVQFPPKLEHLEYHFENLIRQQLNFNFPSSLRKLVLSCTKFCTFNLSLPDLEYMELDTCFGVAPSSVKTLKLIDGGDKYRNFDVPNGVTDLEVPCPLKKYPDSIIKLSISGFEPRKAVPFPKKLRYLNLSGKKVFLEIKDVKVPPSVGKISGSFPFWEIENFNARARDVKDGVGDEENDYVRRNKHRCVIC